MFWGYSIESKVFYRNKHISNRNEEKSRKHSDENKNTNISCINERVAQKMKETIL